MQNDPRFFPGNFPASVPPLRFSLQKCPVSQSVSQRGMGDGFRSVIIVPLERNCAPTHWLAIYRRVTYRPLIALPN